MFTHSFCSSYTNPTVNVLLYLYQNIYSDIGKLYILPYTYIYIRGREKMRIDKKFLNLLKSISLKYLEQYRREKEKIQRKGQIYGYSTKEWYESKIWLELRELYQEFSSSSSVLCTCIYTTESVAGVEYMIFFEKRILYVSLRILTSEYRFKVEDFQLKKEIEL